MKKTLMAVDGNSLMHRAFHALPIMISKDGVYTNAVYGFFSMLINALLTLEPDYIAIAFDKKGKTFRHDAFEDYKATRKPPPDELIPQFDTLKKALGDIGIEVLEQEGFEADDILGVLSRIAAENGMDAVLLTGDKDALQLVSDSCRVMLTKKGVSVIEMYDPRKLYEDYALVPAQIVDLKGFMGDKSDNIPGVPGVGEKTALSLLKSYKDMDGVYAHVYELKGKLKEKIEAHKELAFLSRELARIDTYAPVDVVLSRLKFPGFTMENAAAAFKKLGFSSLIKRLEPKLEPAEQIKQKRISNMQALDEVLGEVQQVGQMAIAFGVDITLAVSGSEEYAMAIEHSLLNMDFTRDMVLAKLAPLLEDEDITLLMFDAKVAFSDLYGSGIEPKGKLFDARLAEYVIDPASATLTFEQIAEKYAAGGSASAIVRLYDMQMQKLRDDGLWYVYSDIELPLMRVLLDMERTGFRIGLDMLKSYDKQLCDQIGNLTAQIYELSGYDDFNINSTKQLSEVLFERLGLPAGKKRKTGYSTDIEVLEQLSGRHPVIDKLIEYRRLTKLKSTYIDGLSKIADKNGFVHTTFMQISTVTGRISSKEPNLQNIPIRTQEGREIRRLFLPSTEDNVLVVADYSQIELRILASIADDLVMKETFKDGIDIHTRTASEVFGVPVGQVSESMRRSAKAVNFGIVYGISDFGLARNLGISVKKAGSYITRYFERFEGVRMYMDEIIARAKADGFVTTLLGRRRYLPELMSANYNIRAFGERAALNTPIQGTAADIIKLAMIDVSRTLQKGGFSSKLILQVHDELVIDTLPDEKSEVKELLKNCMENAYTLDVPLAAQVCEGSSWLEAK